MKIRLFILFSFFTLLSLSGQNFGNEWINYAQPHFKIEVSQEGIHRISSSVINQNGLNFINPNNFRMFRDGVEIPIFVNQVNNVANYIEFYGYPNDGTLDTRLFKDPNHQLHDKYSLFDDKAIYYLTWNTSGGNARINTVANNLVNLPAKEASFFHVSRQIFTNAFSIGKPTYLGSTALYNSQFDEGEGFYSNSQFNNTTQTLSYNIATPNAVPGNNANLKTVSVSWSNGAHDFEIKTGINTLSSHQFNEFRVNKINDIIPAAFVGATTNVTFQANVTSSSTNRNNPALIDIEYRRNFNFNNTSSFIFEIVGNNAVQYLEIENLDEQGTQPILYDVSNGYRIVALDAVGSNIHRFALPPVVGKRKLIIRADNSSNFINVASLEALAFTNFNDVNNQGDYIILTHNTFINTSQINNYVAHRESFLGGSHQVTLVDIDQLYDQFGYGVDKHPQAIRNFIDFALNNWNIEPKNIFIVGKAREYKDYRTNAAVRDACLIPTFGNPGSDVLLAADISSAVPKIGIGRLAITQTVELSNYLDKIIAYDQQYYNFGDPYQTIAQKDYMKHIIHLGGGTDLFEQNAFRSYLNSYANIAKGTSWGTVSSSVFKNSSAPIQTLPSELIRNRINNGVSLITFFGHSYAGGFDVSFDDPENYTNFGKYPIFLANGCNSGLIHAASQSISERFVLSKDKGAIAYLSTTDLSASTALNAYTTNFYNSLSGSNYNGLLGEVIKNTINEVENCCENSTITMMVAQEMTLHGDPAIPFNQYPSPDYALESQNVLFSPNTITTSLDSFDIQLAVYNLGMAVNDSFSIEVTRIYPSGNQEVYNKKFAAPYYLDTFTFTLPVSGGFDGLGLNQFNLYVDVDNEIQNELSETNNYLLNQVTLFIASDNIFPIYPYEFAIVPEQGVTLKSSTGNPFEQEKWYVYQIDTSELFTNPLAQERIFSAGGVIPWTPNVTMFDSTVYYWRVSIDSIYTNSFQWKYSSFIYIANEFPGWNQSHYYQWQKDSYENIVVEPTREFTFIDVPKEVYIKTGLFPNLNFEEMEWKMDGAQMHNWKMNNCGGGVGFPNGLSIALIDNLTGVAIPVVNNSTSSSYGPFGNIHCVGVENVITVANFRASGTTPANHPTPGIPWSDLILDYLNNVPSNYYVLIYSINNPSYASWDANLLSYLNNLNCPVSNSTAGPMIFVYQKNINGFTPIVNIGTSFSDIVTETFTINGTWTSGNIKSTEIGPALEWGSFHWNFHPSENPSDDEQSVQIYGVNASGETLLLNIPESVLDTSLASINAAIYPNLRLKLLTSDVPDRTPSQLDFWRVLYKKPPEAAINPLKYFATNKDTLMQGETWTVSVALENVTNVDMDSITVKYSVKDPNNAISTTFGKNDSLLGFDTLHLQFSKNTLAGANGMQGLTIEANPYEQGHQLEQFHFNNFANLTFFVDKDETNPLLDVSFDGRKILDGDLVSAKPEIVIQLKDENQFLALDDTSLFNIYFRYLGEDGNSPGVIERSSFSDIQTQFIPATNSGNNEAKVILQKEFERDGYYELLVRSSDKSGNFSSSTDNRLNDLVYYDYKISFLIENEASISNIINYPNPFTTRTQFIFTLTGSEIPDFFEIQIMNVKGTVVKTIRQDEFGPIQIGLNKSEYWWDGTDQYEDALANGVYFYKVKSSLQNENLKSFSIEQVDKYFEKGIGKMVLIR